MQPFVVTLCGLLIYRGVARWYTNDATAASAIGDELRDAGMADLGPQLRRAAHLHHSAWSRSIMGVVLHRSVFGRYLFAVGKNEEAARFSGIRTRCVIIAAYVICGGLLTGLSAVFIAFYTHSISPAAHGNFYELYAIAAAVLGGCSLRGGEGSILGIVLGTVLLQVLQNLVNLLGIPSSLNFAVMGAVILLGVLADQQLQRRRARQVALLATRRRRRRCRPGPDAAPLRLLEQLGRLPGPDRVGAQGAAL